MPNRSERSRRNTRRPPSAATKQHHNSTKMRSNRPKRQPTRQARHPGTRTPHGRKAKRRRAGRRSATKPHPTQESRGRKGLAPGLAPGPIPPAKRPHTTVWRQTRVRERSEVMTLHRRPVAALTNLSYTSKPQPVSNYTKCRYNLVYSRLHGLVTKASSKSHGAFLRLLGSRFTEVSVAQQYIGPSYVLSTRV